MKVFLIIPMSFLLLLIGCADYNDSTQATKVDEQNDQMAYIKTTMMSQCQDLFKTLDEMGKVDATASTTDAICRCQTNEMMKDENLQILAGYYQDTKKSTKNLEAMMQSTMTKCAERYYVNLDLWD